MRQVSCTCGEAELLISMALDGECSSQQLDLLREHLSGCEACRDLEKEYRQLDLMLEARASVLPLAVPPPPALPFIEKQSPKVVSLQALAWGRRFVAVATGFFLFFAGQQWGAMRLAQPIAAKSDARLDSAYLVSAPSLWLTSRGSLSEQSAYQAETEKPFVERIDRYRLTIGEELRAEEVDWAKVRRLVEAMGELRTDLELLTLHMAYLEIKTGSPAAEVAYQWEHLGDMALGRSVKQ